MIWRTLSRTAMMIPLAGLCLCSPMWSRRGTGLDIGLETLVRLGVNQGSVRGVHVAVTPYGTMTESTIVINCISSDGPLSLWCSLGHLLWPYLALDAMREKNSQRPLFTVLTSTVSFTLIGLSIQRTVKSLGVGPLTSSCSQRKVPLNGSSCPLIVRETNSGQALLRQGEVGSHGNRFSLCARSSRS